jgi:nitrogen-specific signal transduction histidine kinase
MNVVLILAEERSVCEALRVALPDGALPIFEASVEAAGRRLVALKPDVILLDDAPGLGVQALAGVRAAAPGTPVVLLSGRGDLVTQAALLRAGAREVLVKPFSCETLRDLLAKVALRVPAPVALAPVAQGSADREPALAQHQMALRWLCRAGRYTGAPERLSHGLVEAACDIFDAVRCAVLLESDRVVRVVASQGIADTICAGLRLSYASGMMRYFDEQASLLDRGTAAEYPDALKELQIINGQLAAPLLRDGRVFGALVLGEKASGAAYSAAERELFSLLARSTSTAFEQASQQVSALTQQSHADALLEHVDAGVVWVAADRTIVQMNPAAARMLDMKAEEVVGRSVQRLGSAFADAVLRGLGDDPAARTATIRDAASASDWDLHLAPMNGEGVLVTFYAARTQQGSTEDIAQSPFWEYLSSRVAQEIKNPMVAINTFAQLLPRKYDSEDFRDAYSRVVQREIERINGVVETLFEFARDPKLTLKVCNLNQTLEGVIQSFESEFADRAIRLETKWDPKAEEAELDPEHFAHALQNVVQNSIDAMPEGGTLYVETQKAANGTTIRIRDTGPGVKPEVAPRIFLPFYSTKEQGMGLGLPITKRIVEQHKGSVNVVDKEMGGGGFEIHLPAMEKSHADDSGH